VADASVDAGLCLAGRRWGLLTPGAPWSHKTTRLRSRYGQTSTLPRERLRDRNRPGAAGGRSISASHPRCVTAVSPTESPATVVGTSDYVNRRMHELRFRRRPYGAAAFAVAPSATPHSRNVRKERFRRRSERSFPELRGGGLKSAAPKPAADGTSECGRAQRENRRFDSATCCSHPSAVTIVVLSCSSNNERAAARPPSRHFLLVFR
jgi:hypothetical protein